MRNPPLILIVEDNPDSLDILQIRLTTQDYAVITARDGEEGLALARERLPDLILLDIMMPKMDGIEVCRHIKNDPDLPFMPIIMVTAKADSHDIVKGLEAGGDEYLTKPVDHASLMARVASMLRIKALHDTVMEQSAQMSNQLKTAAQVQSLFWPQIPTLGAGGRIWAVSIPATYVGGDLYDIIRLSDGSVIAYVADVSDKGVPAALIMAALWTKIRGEAPLQHEIENILSAANKSLYRLASDEGYFATIVMVRFWPASGKMELALGGHLQPLWMVAGSLTQSPCAKGISLGVAPASVFEKREIILSRGDAMLLFSDGVIEAANEAGELFGGDRLERCIGNTKGPPWGSDVLTAVNHWRGNASANDDLTLLEIWRQ